MTKHQKIDVLPNIDRRSFLVGTAATGLVFGYVGAPADQGRVGGYHRQFRADRLVRDRP